MNWRRHSARIFIGILVVLLVVGFTRLSYATWVYAVAAASTLGFWVLLWQSAEKRSVSKLHASADSQLLSQLTPENSHQVSEADTTNAGDVD